LCFSTCMTCLSFVLAKDVDCSSSGHASDLWRLPHASLLVLRVCSTRLYVFHVLTFRSIALSSDEVESFSSSSPIPNSLLMFDHRLRSFLKPQRFFPRQFFFWRGFGRARDAVTRRFSMLFPHPGTHFRTWEVELHLPSPGHP